MKTVYPLQTKFAGGIINIAFPDWVIVKNFIPGNMIINLGCASVDNRIPRDDNFEYHPIRECNIYIILHKSCLQQKIQIVVFYCGIYGLSLYMTSLQN